MWWRKRPKTRDTADMQPWTRAVFFLTKMNNVAQEKPNAIVQTYGLQQQGRLKWCYFCHDPLPHFFSLFFNYSPENEQLENIGVIPTQRQLRNSNKRTNIEDSEKLQNGGCNLICAFNTQCFEIKPCDQPGTHSEGSPWHRPAAAAWPWARCWSWWRYQGAAGPRC